MLGVPESQLPLERSWDFREWGLTPVAYEEIHRLAVTEHRLLRELPVIDDAADTLWRLSDAGVWIRIITHRLYVNWGHAIAVSDTVTWLDEARIPYRDICFLGAKPEVEADLYIDDGPHNVEGLLASRQRGDRVRSAVQPSRGRGAGRRRGSRSKTSSTRARRDAVSRSIDSCPASTRAPIGCTASNSGASRRSEFSGLGAAR